MGYVDFKKAFHNPVVDERALYAERFNAPEAVYLDVQVSNSPAFFLMTQDVYEMLDSLAKNDQHKWFHGLVNKYYMLTGGDGTAFRTLTDIRAVYDELLLEEIMADDKKSAPDGDLFRKYSVGVCSPTQKLIYEGLMPEAAISVANHSHH